MAHPSPEPQPRRENWASLFQDSARPLFVLYRTRRIRFVNAAWEKLTGVLAANAIGSACVRSGSIEPIFRALAPTREAIAGQVSRVRRTVPPLKAGPPWWDITFIPFTSSQGHVGFLGLIDLVTAEPAVPPKKLSPSISNVREKIAASYPFELFRSETAAGQQLLSQVHLAAQTAVPVWIVGEPGSGKETLARVIHHNSAHRERAFVSCDCIGLQPYLIDAILFGLGGLGTHGKIGTLFLENPGHLPRDLQQKILDWLLVTQHPPRLICSSPQSATEGVQSGRLREEFRTDFSVLELRVPPLRERPADLTLILSRWANTVNEECLPILRAHTWPGNIAELRDTVATASHEAAGQTVLPSHLPRYLRERALLATNPAALPERSWDLDAILTAVEKRLIEAALAKTDGNQTEAAKRLGIFRTRLARRIEALGIGKSAE